MPAAQRAIARVRVELGHGARGVCAAERGAIQHQCDCVYPQRHATHSVGWGVVLRLLHERQAHQAVAVALRENAAVLAASWRRFRDSHFTRGRHSSAMGERTVGCVPKRWRKPFHQSFGGNKLV